MSNPYRTPALAAPDSLTRQLAQFRRRVWRQKMGEALLFAVCVLLAASLIVWALDRVVDTPPSFRVGVLVVVAAAGAAIPWCFYRWVYQRRRLVQVARLLSRRMPRLGDSLLGVLELVADPAAQARSESLCAAAMEQVAQQAQQVDFNDALPPSRLRAWAIGAGTVASVATLLMVCFPQATANAWTRLLAPWAGTPRYTLTALEPLPESMVVPHGEPFTVRATLQKDSPWRPTAATARIGNWSASATRDDGAYRFSLPPLLEPADLSLRVGDVHPTIRVTPMLRPELQRVFARIQLPDYLGRPDPAEQDLAGGVVTVLAGSRVQLVATANRPLTAARFEQRPIAVASATFQTPEVEVIDDQTLTLEWEDRHGLAGAEPFTASVVVAEDRRPTVSANHLPGEQVVLTTATVPFQIVAKDDYGVRRVGYQWRRATDPSDAPSPASGERLLAAGGPQTATLEADAVFAAAQLGIPPGPIELRLFVEDYRPAGARVYSRPYRMTLLTPEQHAAWLGDQLHRWHQRALELRDRELQLYEANRALRALPPESLATAATRRRLRQQAAAERANAEHLTRVSAEGAELIRAAINNASIDAEQLEQWATMLEVLQQIATRRMPAVADLLEASAAAPSTSRPQQPASSAGVVRDAATASAAAANPPQEATPPAPSIVDAESTAAAADQPAPAPAANDPATPGRTTFAETTLRETESAGPPPTAAATLQEAVEEQSALLAEFQQLSGEIQAILANLEGSTLVKRLKAEARRQDGVADKVNDQLEAAFGRVPDALEQADRDALAALANQQVAASEKVAQIIDDMQAYLARRPLPRFQVVLDEMQENDVAGSLRQAAAQIDDHQGASLALAEYWADALDRWADELVDPASSSSSAGGKSADSLPPVLVLAALRILQAEVDLREATRVAEQSRPVVEPDVYRRDADALADRQTTLAERVAQLTRDIALHPAGANVFQRELSLLDSVQRAMRDAAAILARPDTGEAAIAAETEAIERLLQSRRIHPSGGTAGDAPGGSQGEGVADAALALLAPGDNQQTSARPSNVVQATGAAGVALPVEYRAGLDRYFSRLEAVVQPQPQQ